jgi:hypothetical protein
MKQILLFIICGVLSVRGNSQTYKGQFLAGGNMGFERLSSHRPYVPYESTYTSFNLSPDVGYFIARNLAGGIRFEYDFNKASLNTEVKNHYFSIAPFVRYYILPAKERINIFADAGISRSASKQNYENGSYKDKHFSFNIMAGPVFFINPSIGLEFTIGFRNEFNRDYLKETDNSLTSRIGFQVHLGNAKQKKKA